MKPMKDPLGVSPSKGNQGTTRGKEKFFWPLFFFFTSCGSLIPFTRANTLWVFHGLHIAAFIYTSELILCSTICSQLIATLPSSPLFPWKSASLTSQRAWENQEEIIYSVMGSWLQLSHVRSHLLVMFFFSGRGVSRRDERGNYLSHFPARSGSST